MTAFTHDSALVLFSGGQDSTVCLAWALKRFARVETVGFDYGQRHVVELRCGRACASAWPRLKPEWEAVSATIIMVTLEALAAISDTALTRETAIEFADSGLPTTFVPGAQPDLLHLRRRAGLSPRRPPSRRRHVRNRLFRLSGLPRRHHQGHAGGAQPRHGQALHHAYAADVDRQGRNLRASPRNRRRSRCSISWSRTPIAAISATARTGTSGATAAARARPASCARKGMRKFMAQSTRRQDNDQRNAQEHRRRDISGAVLPDHSGGELDDRPCRHRLRCRTDRA